MIVFGWSCNLTWIVSKWRVTNHFMAMKLEYNSWGYLGDIIGYMTNDTTRICLIFLWHMFNGENCDKLWEFVVTIFKTTKSKYSNHFKSVSYNFVICQYLTDGCIHASLLQLYILTPPFVQAMCVCVYACLYVCR